MKFTVLVENMYLQAEDDWLNETSGDDSDTRTMLQKFKDWVKSMALKLANVISTSFNKFMSMMKEIWARGVLLAKRIVGKLSKEDYEKDKERVSRYHKTLREAASAGRKAMDKEANKLKDGEYKTIQDAFDKGHENYQKEIDRVFQEKGFVHKDVSDAVKNNTTG